MLLARLMKINVALLVVSLTIGMCVTSLHAQSSTPAPQPDKDGFMRNLSLVEFEEELDDKYGSTYNIYEKLSPESKTEVYGLYQSGVSYWVLRKSIIDRFSHEKLTR